MIKQITHSSIPVLDHEEALDFYVGKLGFEVKADVNLEVMRWVTVNVPGDPDREILLEKLDPPIVEEEDAAAFRELITKGAIGMACVLATDDCQGDYEDLKAKGVEFTQEPTERFYGIDCGFRDPFGNHIRLTQPAEGEIVPPKNPADF